MKKIKLSLNELEETYTVIEAEEKRSLKGGDWLQNFYDHNPQGTYSSDYVNSWYKIDPINPYSLPYYTPATTPWGNYDGYGGQNNPIQLNEVHISGNSSSALGDAMAMMLSSMGMSATQADVAAAVMKLETKGFTYTSRAFGVIDVASNIQELLNGTGDWQDGAQAAMGALLMVPGLNGGVVIVGALALTGWELYEMLHEQ